MQISTSVTVELFISVIAMPPALTLKVASSAHVTVAMKEMAPTAPVNIAIPS